MCLAFGGAFTTRASPLTRPWQIGLKGVFVAWVLVAVFSPAQYAFTTFFVWTWGGLLYRRPEPAAAPVRLGRRLERPPVGPGRLRSRPGSSPPGRILAVPPPVESNELRALADSYPWYHTLELGQAVVTNGMFDHRPVLDHYPIPDDFTRQRCLDVATMDGFWAFEMERRGAASVTALDLEDPEELDWPVSLRAGHDKSMDETKAERFELAKRSLGSSVERVLMSAYDLSPELGTFDFVFCGDLLLHLKDPITPVENIRSVCTGSAVIVNVIKKFRLYEGRPMAELDGIDVFQWWLTNLEGLVRIVPSAGFARVEPSDTFELPFADGNGDWEGLRGAVRAYV